MLSVYLRPFPPDASRLSFHIEDFSAEREDGGSVPLSLLFTEARGDLLTSERRLTTRGIPAGRYSGLALRIGGASLRGEQGPSVLTSPEEPMAIKVPFTVERQRAVVLALRLNYRDSVHPGSRFEPSLTATTPQRLAPGLIAMASNQGSNSVTLFDKVSGEVVGLIPTGSRPIGLAIDPNRRRAYVAASGDDTIEAIGLLEQNVLNRLTARGGDEPVDLVLTPDGRTLLSANMGSNTVSVLEAMSLVETARIQVGNGPSTVLIDHAGRRAYTFNSSSSSVTAIDIAARAVVATVGTEAGPLRGQFSRDGDKLYVIHRSSPYLTVIDPLSLAVTARVYVGPGAVTLKVDPLTDRIYLVRRGTGVIEVYDPLSFLPVDTIPVEDEVSFMTIDAEGNNLYLVLARKNQVQVVGIVGKGITARVEVGEDPGRVALVGER